LAGGYYYNPPLKFLEEKPKRKKIFKSHFHGTATNPE